MAAAVHAAGAPEWELVQRSSMSLPGTARSVAFSADGSRLAAAGDAGLVVVRDAVSGKELWRARGADRIAFSPIGGALAGSRSSSARVTVWDEAGQVIASTGTWNGALLSYFPDGKSLALACGWLGVWEIGAGFRFQRRGPAVSALVVSTDGAHILAGGPDHAFRRLSAVDGSETDTSRADQLDSIALSPDGRWVATAGAATRTMVYALREWEAGSWTQAGFVALTCSPRNLSSSPDGDWLASTCVTPTGKARETLVIYRMPGLRESARLALPRKATSTSMALDPVRVAVSFEGGAVRVYGLRAPSAR